MRSRPTAALALVLLASLPVLAQTAPPSKPGVRDLTFLSGHWVDSTGNRVAEEVWMPLSGDAMVGVRRVVSDGKLVVVELLSIREEAGGPVLRLRRFNGDLAAREEKGAPVSLPLVERTERYVRFSGTEPGAPGEVTVTYKLETGTLKATLTREGKTDDFRFRAVRGEGPGGSRRWGGRRPGPQSEAPPSTGGGGA
jgi:hypothetical protein